MKNAILILLFVAFNQFMAFGQYYSGKYVCNPAMEDFDHIIIHQHPHHHKYGGDLTVKAFVEQGELWQATALMVSEEKAEEIKNKFAGDLKVLSVYEVDIELDGEEWEYFLLGFENDKKHGSFLVVEEIFDLEDLSKPIEINKAYWNRVHGQDHRL